ncbi:MAG: hypothetical protein QXJ06_00450 [Candidatus Aenigmatarchaeota archaeon]
MKKILFIIIILIIFISGCTQQNSNEKNLEVSFSYSQKIVCGMNTVIDVNLLNKLPKKIKNVYISIDNFESLEFKEIKKCDGILKDYGCFINEIDPFDEKKVTFILNIPKNICLGNKIKFMPQFSIFYEYSDQKIWKIPIIGDKIKDYNKKKLESINEGPIQISLSVNGVSDAINIRSDDFIEINIDVYDTGNNNNLIEKDNFILTFYGFQIYNLDSCEFQILETDDLNYFIKLKPIRDVQLPKDSFKCILKTKNLKDDEWFDGTIILDYNYNYNIISHIELST